MPLSIFPLSKRSLSASFTQDLDGVRTEIIVQPFSDRNMVMVTQLDKIGTVLLVSIEDTRAGEKHYDVQVS